MAKRFITPFAEAGDRAAMPDTPVGTDSNYQTGYPSQYEEDPVVNPATAKFVERDKSNQLYNDITANIKEWQEHTYPAFIASAVNGGVPFSYKKNSIVTYLGIDYASSVDANTDVPPSSKWEVYTTSLINNLSQTYEFATVALFKVSTIEFPDGKKIHLQDRNANFTKITGTGTADTFSIIASTSINQSVSIVPTSSMSIDVFGAIGDGVANETTLFAVADTYTETTFDLLGKTYAVDALPSGNYINGEFIIGVIRYQKPLNDSHEYAKAQFNLKRDYSDTRFVAEMVPALENGTVILGDSIAHGAYQGALYDNGWVNLLKRMINAENDHSVNGSYGLIPLLSWNIAPLNNTVDLASIAFINSPVSVFTIEGEQLLNALAFEITTTATVKSTLPTFQSTVRVWYVQHTGGGTLEVFVNGVSVATQDTSGALDLAANITVTMSDDGFGEHVIEVKASAGTVTFTGFGYENATNVVNNFAQSGRKLLDATEMGLKQLCTTGNLIMCLGHNDVGVVDGTPANETIFTNNINFIIENCIRYNTNVVVPDFCWFTNPDSYVRNELKRLALETSGIYIDFPSLLTRDYRSRNEFGDAFLLVDTMHYFHDASHPNELGGQFIAETIAKAIGLGCTTKSEAMAFHDFPMPLTLDGTDLKNRFTTVPNLSNVRRNGNVYAYNIRSTKLVGGGGLPVGIYTLNTTGNLPIPETSNGRLHGVGDLKQSDGSNISNFSVDQQGKVTIFVTQQFLDHQEFSFTRMKL